MAQTVKRLPAIWETWIRSLGLEDPLEKEITTHARTLAWKIPWMEEPGRLQSMGSQRVWHSWAPFLSFPFSFFNELLLRMWKTKWEGLCQERFKSNMWFPPLFNSLIFVLVSNSGISWNSGQMPRIKFNMLCLTWKTKLQKKFFSELKFLKCDVHRSTVYNCQDMEAT